MDPYQAALERLHARGRAGHGSVPNEANAVVRLAEAVGRIAAYPWPRAYIASVRALLAGLSALTGAPAPGFSWPAALRCPSNDDTASPPTNACVAFVSVPAGKQAASAAYLS